MEYKGIKLTEVTESQIVDPPKKMLVWDCEPGIVLEADVLAIVNERESGYPVITTTGVFRHCAEIPLEIPEEPKPRRATNRELSKWLAKGHGEYTDAKHSVSSYSTYAYLFDSEETKVGCNILVRKWDDVGWHEPTVDYMGIE